MVRAETDINVYVDASVEGLGACLDDRAYVVHGSTVIIWQSFCVKLKLNSVSTMNF